MNNSEEKWWYFVKIRGNTQDFDMKNDYDMTSDDDLLVQTLIQPTILHMHMHIGSVITYYEYYNVKIKFTH